MVGAKTPNEVDLLDKLVKVLDGLDNVSNVRYASDGVHDTGSLSFGYLPPNAHGSQKPDRYTLELVVEGIKIVTHGGANLPKEIMDHMNTKFPDTKYERPYANGHFWIGAKLA